ncbi:MAG: sigma-70 family RNA polymerase sigma factor [Saccharofermentanales bacterium]
MTVDETLHKYEKFLWHMAHKFHIDGYTTEDLWQEFALVLTACHKTFDPDRGTHFKTFLYKSIMARAYHLIKDQDPYTERLDNSIDREGHTFLDNIEDPMPTPDEQDVIDDVHAFMEPYFEGRDGLILKEVLRGTSYRQLGEALGLSKQRVHQIYTEGLKRLKDDFAQYLGRMN